MCNDLNMTEITESPFSKSYAAARALFQREAHRAGAQLNSYAYPERGPDGEELTTDVAWIGPADATHVFVTVSGTHGVEGFCGSAAQVDWLTRGEAKRLPSNSAAMLIHALNPFGFAWLRRVTHENIDLNRNWIDFSTPLPQRPAYDEIAAVLCPAEWTKESQAQTFASLQQYIAKNGYAALASAVSSGQYAHSSGLFFGGTGPAFARRTLETIFRERLSSARHIGIIDYHTGLGPFGYGEIMMNAPRGSDKYKRVCSWYGAAVVPVGAEDSASASIGGDWISAIDDLAPQAEITAMALEIGTVSALQVLDALRADNWLHAHGTLDSELRAPIKQKMLNAFYVDSDIWKGMALGQSLAVCRQALAGLHSPL
jgi:hypothetical protein